MKKIPEVLMQVRGDTEPEVWKSIPYHDRQGFVKEEYLTLRGQGQDMGQVPVLGRWELTGHPLVEWSQQSANHTETRSRALTLPPFLSWELRGPSIAWKWAAKRSCSPDQCTSSVSIQPWTVTHWLPFFTGQEGGVGVGKEIIQ